MQHNYEWFRFLDETMKYVADLNLLSINVLKNESIITSYQSNIRTTLSPSQYVRPSFALLKKAETGNVGKLTTINTYYLFILLIYALLCVKLCKLWLGSSQMGYFGNTWKCLHCKFGLFFIHCEICDQGKGVFFVAFSASD